MLRTVIYARYSSEKQNEQSIEGQIHECQQYAESHDMVIVNQYIDRALSGKTDDRPAFLKMIKDSASGIFDAVLVYKTDRFARNRYDSAVYKSKLKKNGVKIFYAKENIPDGPEGIILESLLEGMAEYYSSELSQKVKRGIRENVKKGLSFGGACPFGYKIVDKRYTIDETQAPYVKKIFEEYVAGRRAIDICRELNQMPDYAGRGRRWINSAIVWILKNKKYIGVYTFEDITISDAIPAIVSEDLFERAQTRLKYNKHHVSRDRVNYLLSGRMYCGFCGRAMTGKSGTSHTGARYHYYVCRNKQCHQKKFRIESLEKLIIDNTIRQMLNPSKFDIIADHCIELYRKEMQNDEILAVFQNQLKDATIKHANIMKAIEAGIITKGIKQRLDELEQNIRHLEVKIYNRRADHKPDLTKAQIIYLLKHYYEHREDKTFYSRIIDGFVYKIFIYEKVICLTYNLAESRDELVQRDVDIVLDGSPTDRYGAPLANQPLVYICTKGFCFAANIYSRIIK